MISFEEVAVLDRNSEYWGVPPEELMENAGKGLAEEIEERYPDRPVLFVCGTGNNGGDAYVATRYLNQWREEQNITVYLLKGKENVRTDIARKNLKKLECRVVEDLDWDEVDDTVIVDALLGTGVKGNVREPYRSAILNMNGKRGPLLSVDVPSGLGADVRTEPELTVTFHDVKEGMDEERCGEIVVKDIGMPEKAQKYTGPGEMLLYPAPDEDSHKGDNGELLIVGGGPYTGAPALAAKAAYRTGVDLVHLAVPTSIRDIVAGYSPSFIVHPLDGEYLTEENIDEVKQTAKRCDAVIIGPGLGRKEETLKAVRELTGLNVPKAIDADGLHALKSDDWEGKDTVLTPHKGEFRMLAGLSEEIEKVADGYAQEKNVTLIVKGEEDYVTDGERKKWNDFGNPAMTVGGTGDTLSGAVGALLAKGMSTFNAARLGVYITCKAGEEAFKDWSWGMMPEDLSEYIPKVLDENY